MDYKIGIVIPVYNAAAFLRDAMQSLLSQSIGFENLQVIAVDDCSTDDSYAILSEYANTYPNIEVYCTEENSGAAGIPRNIGLAHVKAPYVMFLDPDDFYEYNACEVLYNKISETKVEIVGGRFYVVDSGGKNPVPGEQDFPEMETRYELPKDMMTVINWIQPIWQRIFDLSFIKENNIAFPKGYGQDTVFLNRCFVNGCTLIQIGNYILNYRRNPCSVTHRIDKKFFERYLPCTYEFEKILAPYPKVLKIRKHREAHWHFSMLMSATHLGKDGIVEILDDCRELFVGYTEGNENYVFLSQMVANNLVIESAEYVLKCRECIHNQEELERERIAHKQCQEALEREKAANRQCQVELEQEKREYKQCQMMLERARQEKSLMINAYENRVSLQLVNAVKKRRFWDIIKIVERWIQNRHR